MDSYTSFAQVYDLFMDNVPYEEWSAHIQKVLRHYGIEEGLVLDLGCGTGNMTEALAAMGYDMIGIDNSEEMLDLALEKRRKSGHDILYLNQNMQEFELYGTVRAIVCTCDSINYITDEDDLLEVFRLVNNYLDPKGIFVFDFNTEYKYREVLRDQTFAEDRENSSFIWENYYYEDDWINEYDLTLFIRDEKQPEFFRKFHERHIQRVYTLDDMRELLERAGMEFINAYDGYTRLEPTRESERLVIIAREKGK
ncbi:MAG: class I SAM-dependent methyltransferase [Dorea sp.]|nr:class I SAM-dependent methyltransferase [Dorea sp.]